MRGAAASRMKTEAAEGGGEAAGSIRRSAAGRGDGAAISSTGVGASERERDERDRCRAKRDGRHDTSAATPSRCPRCPAQPSQCVQAWLAAIGGHRRRRRGGARRPREQKSACPSKSRRTVVSMGASRRSSDTGREQRGRAARPLSLVEHRRILQIRKRDAFAVEPASAQGQPSTDCVSRKAC